MRSATVIDWGGWPLTTTAGRRPDSMRAMRAVRAGSGACAGEDRGLDTRAKERLLAESLGESKEELEIATASAANAAVRSIRVFATVELIGDLMGGNRTTFESETIRLVGCARGKNLAAKARSTCGRNR